MIQRMEQLGLDGVEMAEGVKILKPWLLQCGDREWLEVQEDVSQVGSCA